MRSRFHIPVLWIGISFFLVFLLNPLSGIARKDEKKKKVKKDTTAVHVHSPHKATLWALIPGAGQIYNRKYWKLPIVYAGFGVIGYFVVTNRNEYIKYNNAYICSAKADDDPDYECTDPIGSKYETSYIQQYRDYYRRNTELSFIIMAGWYVLQMLDATVDAHLFNWEVDDKLSMRIDPVYQPAIMPSREPGYKGLRLTVSF